MVCALPAGGAWHNSTVRNLLRGLIGCSTSLLTTLIHNVLPTAGEYEAASNACWAPHCDVLIVCMAQTLAKENI